jgi:uncharacterized membrane protein YczE
LYNNGETVGFMKQFIIRFLNMIIGIILYALGIVVTIKANIGYAPWEVFHVGLGLTFGITIGVASIIAGMVILIIVMVMGEKLGLGTIANMILIGVFIDIFLVFNIIPTSDNFVIGIAMLVAGLFIISLGSFFYIKSAFGAGPRDSLMVALARKTKLPVGLCRGAIELIVTVSGWFLGGMVGAGTVISVILVGFCIQITFKVLKFDVTAVKHETLIKTFAGLIKKITALCGNV